MSITYVASSISGTNSIIIPTHQAGDLIIFFGYSQSAVAPIVSAEVTAIDTVAGGGASAASGFILATSGSEVSGTWGGNTEGMLCHVYRSNVGALSIGASVMADRGFSNNIVYDALTLSDTSGSSWAVGMAGHDSNNVSINTPPTGMVNRSFLDFSPFRAAGHDTNGGVTTWAEQTVAVGGSGNSSASTVIEVIETSSSVVITNITDPLNTNAQSTINGTGFEAAQGTGKVEQNQGANITTLTIDTWGDLQVLADGLDIESTLYNYGTHDLKVTANGGDSATTAFESIPAINNDYVNITSLATVGDRLTAIPDLAASDQVRYQDFLYSGGSPTAYSVVVNADATFSVDGSTPEGTYTFEVRAWDASDETWGTVANQTVTIGSGPAPGTGLIIEPMVTSMVTSMVTDIILT